MSLSASRCFALLDDALGPRSASESARSRLYTDLARELVCSDPSRLDAICREADMASRDGLHAVLLCDYDFGARLQGLVLKGAAEDATTGCLRILLFRQMTRLTKTEVDAWLAAQDQGSIEPSAAGLCDLHQGVTRTQYDAAIAAIQDWLRAGDCYQINYTYPIHCSAFGTPLALYRRMRARQPAPYGALIALADGRFVLSCSPELFLQHRAGQLTARPMKGTAAAGPTAEQTRIAAETLLADSKNRAENLMIVDLLRNDLGRIALTGSVHVPALFSIERYADLLQMTSTVEARPRPDLTLAEVLRALFPCGSITGAPKLRAMALIDEIETVPRGLYTGAIGWYDAVARNNESAAADTGLEDSLGDFCFSVAIRTLELAPLQDDGLRRGRMGVGGGIVLDSHADQEYQECALKARFLTGLDPGFELFETMYVTRRNGCRYLAQHLRRLRASAKRFGFACDESGIKDRLASVREDLQDDGPYRLRLSLAHDGTIDVRCAPLLPLTEPVQLLLSSQPVAVPAFLLNHKTTLRTVYDGALKEAEQQGAFDMLFFNARGELTEGARSNVFVLLYGAWCTPPLACGVLPGVMRTILLEDPNWNTRERVLTHADLSAAEGIMVCNALRGALPARLLAKPD